MPPWTLARISSACTRPRSRGPALPYARELPDSASRTGPAGRRICTLIQAEGHDDCLKRAAVGQQGHLKEYQLGRPQAGEGYSLWSQQRSCRTRSICIDGSLRPLNAYVSFAHPRPCRTSRIRAKYGLCGLTALSWLDLAVKPNCAEGPLFVNVTPHHGLVGC